MSWELKLPYQKPPLSLNTRMHWAPKAKLTRELRDTAHVLAKAARIPKQQAIILTLHYVPRQNRRRDPSNLLGTQKPLLDGLVDAGIIPDDCPPYVEERMPVIHAASKSPAMWLEIQPKGN